MSLDLSVDSPESLAWQEERSALAATHLAGLAARPALHALLEKHLGDVRRNTVVRRGDRWFQRVVLNPSDEHPVLAVRTSPDGEPRVLVDPNELSTKRGANVSMMGFSPSPDGKYVAYTLDAGGGGEVIELSVLDVETGTALPDTFDFNAAGSVAWLPDSSGFWFNVREITADAFAMPIYRHELGGHSVKVPVEAVTPFLYPSEVSPDGRYVPIFNGNTEVRFDHIVVDGEVRPLLADVEGTQYVRVLGDDVIAVVEEGAPRGRLVRIPIATPSDRSTWTELVPASDDVLRGIEIVDGLIVLSYLRDASAHVRILQADGSLYDEIRLPGAGVVSSVAIAASHPAISWMTVGDGELSFIYSSFASSPATYRYFVADKQLVVHEAAAVQIEGLQVSLINAVSADGVEVPAHVVHRADLDLSRPHPTIVRGYGGYNLAELPGFNPEIAAWTEAGGIWILAHLRGGSEYGTEWWQGGRREKKQNTFNDLYAVAERAIELGLTTAQQLVARGESNGGLLTGVAIVQRPDLWAGVSSDVPLYDTIGYARDPLSFAIGAVEYGNPAVPEEAEWLRAYSPVHNVKPASYPNVLITGGANDPRCPVWHCRVLADLLERNQQGEGQIHLRVYEGQGHGAAGLHGIADKDADWLAFAAEVTGLKV